MALMVAARLAARGRRKGSLDDADCQELPSMCRPAAEVMAAAEAAWAAELQRKRPRGPQVWRVVWAVVWRPTCVGLTCNVLRGCGNAFSLPLLIRAIVQAIVEGDAGRMSFFLVLLLLERALGATLEHWGTRVLSMAVPSGMTLSLSGLVLRKAATLSPGVAPAKSLDPVAFVGREVNMLYMKLGMSIANGAVAMPSLFAGTLTLFLLLGPAAVFGVVWVFFTIRVGTWLMTVAKKSEVKMSSIASDRLSKLSNIVGAVKAIKYFTWEPEFIEEMAAARMKECEALQAKLRLSSMTFTLGKITPVTGALITFVSFALLGNPLQAAEVFAANSVFLTMRFAVGASGMLVEVYKTMQVVNGRAQQLLLLPERPVRSLLAPPPPQDAPVLASAEELRVVYESGDESKDTFVLRGPGALCLARSGQLTAVCGLVGSGKSTILQALLGACDSKATVSGQCRAVESVGWSPQKPFIISGTIRDNILMGRPYDGPRMARCIADACLGRDLELLRDGMEEVIGERGTTLSGGQQARLSLARAMYGEPALLVLDDPLAAVDASVGRAILRALRLRCASPRPGGGSPPGALVVLNQLQVLPNFDQIVVVRAGVVEQCGSWSEFTQHPASIDLMKSVETQTFALDIEDDERVAQSELERAGKHAGGKDLDDLVMSKVSTARSLITKEQAATGLVKWPVLKAYLLAPGGFFLFGVVALFLASFVMLGLRDWWLSVWADADNGKDAIYVWVFSLFSLLHIGGAITGVFAIAVFAKRAGARIHSDCINKLMHAPMSFFDETPSGRIISRFGTDLAMVDGSMPGMIDFTMTFGFTWLMMCITIAANVPWMITIFSFTLVLSIPIIQGLCTFQQDIKRQSNNAMAPVLSNLSEVQSGAALVDSLGCTSFFFLRHQELIDWWIRLSNATLFTRVVADTWIQMVHFLVLLVVGLLTLRGIDHYRRDPGLVAMFFSYAALWGIFATITMNVIMMLITNLTSLERLLEYTLGDLPQEPPWSRAGDPDHKAWPSAGAVSFEGVKIRYRAGLPCALDGLDLRIRGGERLGVVGRTGAGKSTITGALFRLVDCEEGRILVDGVDVSTLGLHTLRRAISMIPQEPIVMSGTVRYNLDPFGRHSDGELLEAMSVVGLAPAVQLEAPAGSGNLSAGQRQLLTFGRTTLQSSRLVVMDEPTASVDVQTDRAVQTAAREAFWGRTVVTIAHRLDTVKDCDRLAVIDAGRLVELGPYEELLQNPASYLSLLVRAEAAGAADRAAGGAAVRPPGGGGGAAPQSGRGPQCGGSAGASAGRGAVASCLGFPFCLPA